MIRFITSLLLVFAAFGSQAEKVYKPYILTLENNSSITELVTTISTQLKANGFKVEGKYKPAEDINRYVIIVSHPNLTKAVQTIGGLTGFASTMRVGLISENGKTKVSYTDPEYWCRAYFTTDYIKVESNVLKVSKALQNTFSKLPGYKHEGFGCKDGLDADDLEDYNYMIGMPEFDDTEELAEYNSHQEALKTIESNFKKGVPNIKKVYSFKVPGKNIVLYGVALSGESGENNFVPKIDIGAEKHTPFLPYEFLVVDNEVHMLHGRFRIALSFPDLTMGTFTKIMSTPGDIEDLIERAVSP